MRLMPAMTFRTQAHRLRLADRHFVVSPASPSSSDGGQHDSRRSLRTSRARRVPGASIRVVNEATGVAVEAFTDEQGSYRRSRAGAADSTALEAMLDGFETVVRRVVLEAGQTATIDVIAGSRRDSPKAWS